MQITVGIHHHQRQILKQSIKTEPCGVLQHSRESGFFENCMGFNTVLNQPTDEMNESHGLLIFNESKICLRETKKMELAI